MAIIITTIAIVSAVDPPIMTCQYPARTQLKGRSPATQRQTRLRR
jgi:hypothetical protein